MIKCPFCAEEIQYEAILCKYCHSNLSKTITEQKEIIKIEKSAQKEALNKEDGKIQTGSPKQGCLFNSVAIIGVILWVLLIISGDGEKFVPATPQPQISEETQVKEYKGSEQEPKKEIIESGIGVSRKSIIDIYEKPALGFSFKEGAPTNGKDNYIATKEGHIIQLLGRADNLSEASVIVFLTSDNEQNLLSFTRVVGFANIIDSNSVDWTTDEFLKVTDNPTKSYSNTKVFDEKLFKVSFTPSSLFIFSLTVSSAK